MAQIYRTDDCETPNIVFVGVPDLQSLNKTLKKLKDNRIPHYPWHEPDFDLGFTAISTIPLTVEQKQVLSNYRLWKQNSPVVQVEQLASKASYAGANPAG